MQVRSRSALFLKENLLNLAYYALPESAKYVAWIDDDITFCQDNLAQGIVEALKRNPVIQLFERAEDLGPEGEIMYTHKSAAAAHRDREALFTGDKVAGYTGNCSHSGYAWAARKEILDACGGFLETCILGGGDAQMAYGFLGMHGFGLEADYAPGYIRSIRSWQDDVWKSMQEGGSVVQGTLGCLGGTIRHSFHGTKSARRYTSRYKILVKHRFDPETDLMKDADGVWELTVDKPELARDIFEYFRGRKEDSSVSEGGFVEIDLTS